MITSDKQDLGSCHRVHVDLDKTPHTSLMIEYKTQITKKDDNCSLPRLLYPSCPCSSQRHAMLGAMIKKIKKDEPPKILASLWCSSLSGTPNTQFNSERFRCNIPSLFLLRQ